MKKHKTIALAAALVPALAGFAPGGDGTGNGGGGVLQNGRYMTFYSAGLYTEPDPKTQPEIPGLDWTVTQVGTMSFLSAVQKTLLVNSLLPSPQHEYYEAVAGEIDDATVARLKAEFQRVTGVDATKIVLYALTDTSKRQTFLMPDFYKLTDPKDQAAILFHESYWLSHPSASYEDVVGAEMAFQAVLAAPGDGARVLDFMRRFATIPELFRYATQTDQATGALAGFADAQFRINLHDLVGDPFLQCIRENDPDCSVFLNLQLGKLVDQYPKSLFLSLLREQAIPADPAGNVGIWYSNFEWSQVVSTADGANAIDMSTWNWLFGEPSGLEDGTVTSPTWLSLVAIPDTQLGQDYSFQATYDFDSRPYVVKKKTIVDHEHGSIQLKFWMPPPSKD
jgi:hypothetical protein